MGRDRWGGSQQGDEGPKNVQSERYADNKTVEGQVVVGRPWWDQDIFPATLHVVKECLALIKRLPVKNRTEDQMTICWFKFEQWIKLVVTTEEQGDVVFMGETLPNFRHNYGANPATQKHFKHHILPSVTRGMRLPKSKAEQDDEKRIARLLAS